MAEKYPKDRFDTIPDDLHRVGAHRAPRPKGRGWIGFGWAALATVVLVGLGVFGLSLVDGGNSFTGKLGSPSATPTKTPTPTPTITPTVNPALSVNVLNGTATAGLANKVGDTLQAAGWKVGARANASDNNLTQTVVYYSDPKNQAAALGVVQSLPGAKIAVTQDYVETGADLTVVVGSDYKG
ncbi:LytR C-terminal domain-containing protein [Leifsonia sp. NPDC058248]|uniref:LytR C-terminal domain-containing protein n=1 Tax=Leifsonia sp. NPDC058248 TaxID=3346402 RepID=UPI0036D9FAE8